MAGTLAVWAERLCCLLLPLFAPTPTSHHSIHPHHSTTHRFTTHPPPLQAMRKLNISLQIAITLLVNGVFLMVRGGRGGGGKGGEGGGVLRALQFYGDVLFYL